MPRLPAEWEAQDAILMAWPHPETDWLETLEAAEQTFAAIIAAIVRYQPVILLCPDPATTRQRLEAFGVNPARVQCHAVSTNDTWARDFGPITIEEVGRPVLQDFGFNGWGLKFASDRDNQATAALHALGVFGDVERRIQGMVLEGGSIESDGEGTLLTTRACLLSPNRNPHWTRERIEHELETTLGAKRVLWLEDGYLEGDDTDSHIDTLARLCPDHTIVYQRCDQPADPHFVALARMETQLAALRSNENTPYRLLALPWPQAKFDPDQHRLPATYANYLVINGAVLVPTYNDPADEAALAVIRQGFPERDIIGINCEALIRQHGSLHCVTMQLPRGTLA